MIRSADAAARKAFTGLLAVVPALPGFPLFNCPSRLRAGAIDPTGWIVKYAPNTISLDHDARLLADLNSRHAVGVTRTV